MRKIQLQAFAKTEILSVSKYLIKSVKNVLKATILIKKTIAFNYLLDVKLLILLLEIV